MERAVNRPGSERARTSQTLARGLQVLDCFLTGVERELGIKDLAGRLNLPQTNVARLVATLVEAGYLVQQPVTRQYRLGLRAYLLGLRANPAEELRRIAHPVLERLATQTGETVSLNVIDLASLEGVCIASIDSPAQIKLTTRVGSVRPLYWGATRKVLLAFAEQHDQEAVLVRAQIDLSPAELTKLRRELAEICENGFAESVEELDEGAYAIAAPVLSPGGALLAGVAVAGPVFRRTETARRRFIDAVLGAAGDIARLIAPGSI
ncbi:IclR family transcriptional regulator [Alicyclobacillus sp. ALC3]|uniref:IclR family transcriptional regulator n=1 Tax=Alicyclobacillus sp. ALC3 TaxID=2796143 RepID=UPI00237905AF|nr:IclR family transcriptional regulator [Alicyclobacillus sp. ALC3]WDL97912.1 IclR family transcriptional regulator [Alicyclobacillus sp. ALC3]